MIDFAIIIPAYNEVLTIKQTLAHIEAALLHDPRAKGLSIVCYVYDNNSTDHTGREVRTFAKNSHYTIALRKTKKQGKGCVVRQAFQEIDAKCYCLIDGDDTYDPVRIMDFYDTVIKRGAEMVIGDRLTTDYFSQNKRPFHNFGNRIVRFLINAAYNRDYKDILSGFRAFSAHFAKVFPAVSDGFTIETEMNCFAAAQKLLVYDLPVGYKDRVAGSASKLKTIPDGMRILGYLWSAIRKQRPAFYFMVWAILFGAFCLGAENFPLGVGIGGVLILYGCFRQRKLQEVLKVTEGSV